MLIRTTYNLIREPEEAIYRSILDVAYRYCDTALLVQRQNSVLSSSGLQVMTALQPSLLREEHLSEWPGTILYGHTALVRYYGLGPCLDVLKSAVPRLFAWLHPDRLEDLCLIRPDGTPWLATITHEDDGFFELDPSEYAQVLDRVPEFENMVRTAE